MNQPFDSKLMAEPTEFPFPKYQVNKVENAGRYLLNLPLLSAQFLIEFLPANPIMSASLNGIVWYLMNLWVLLHYFK